MRWRRSPGGSRRASGGRAGSTPVTVVTRASRTRQRPGTPGVHDAGLAEGGELARGRLQRGAGAVGRRTDDVGEIGVARVDGGHGRLGAGAGDGEEGALLRVGDGAVGGVGGLLQRGGERRPVGGRLAGELVGEAAQQLGEDGAGVAARPEDGAAGEDRPGGLGGAGVARRLRRARRPRPAP